MHGCCCFLERFWESNGRILECRPCPQKGPFSLVLVKMLAYVGPWAIGNRMPTTRAISLKEGKTELSGRWRSRWRWRIAFKCFRLVVKEPEYARSWNRAPPVQVVSCSFFSTLHFIIIWQGSGRGVGADIYRCSQMGYVRVSIS